MSRYKRNFEFCITRIIYSWNFFMVSVQVLESVQFIKMYCNPYANNPNYILPRCKRKTRYCHGNLEKVFKYSSNGRDTRNKSNTRVD